MTAVMPDYTITSRVRGVWKKFCDWYGADVISNKLGAIPSREWCEAIDAIDSREDMTRVLSEVRSKHVNWPPLFPQFEAICKQVKRPPQQLRRERPLSERLVDHVLRTKPLTKRQKVMGWTFIGGAGETFTGVIVPADPDAGAPGYRVMVADMQIGDSP